MDNGAILTTDNRQQWCDIAKGIAIIIVLIGHFRGQLVNDELSIVIATLHNPTFYLVSGFLLGYRHSLEEISFTEFTIKKGIKLIYPFALWTIVYGLIVGVINNSIMNGIIDGANKLWFLPVLFVATEGIVILKKVHMPIWIAMTITCGGMVFFSYYSSMIAKVLASFLTVLFGYQISKSNLLIKCKDYCCLTYILISIVAFYCFGVKYEDTIIYSGIKLLVYLIMFVFGGGLISALSKNISKMNTGFAIVKWFGKNSIYIYVLHFVGIYYIEMMPKTWTNMIIGIVIALIIPMLYIFLVKRYGFGDCLFNLSYTRNKEKSFKEKR